MQSLGDRGDHLPRRLGPPLPLDSRVIVGRHVARRGDLLASEPAGPPARPTHESDVLGLQRLPAAPEELRQSGPVDHGLPPSPCPSRSYRRNAWSATDRRSPLQDGRRIRHPRIDRPWMSSWRPASLDGAATRQPTSDNMSGAQSCTTRATSPPPTSSDNVPWSPEPATASASASPTDWPPPEPNCSCRSAIA